MTQTIAAAPARTGRHFSPFIQHLRDQRPGREDRVGLFHTLTGECLEIADAALPAIPAGDGDDDALDEALEARGFLVRDARAPALLAPFLDWPLVIPAHTPTLVATGHGRTLIYRPDGLDTCCLPRGAFVPGIAREPLDESGAGLVACAAANLTLRQTMARLGLTAEATLHALGHLTRADRQLLRVAPTATALEDLRAQLHYPMQNFALLRATEAATAHYAAGIGDAQWEFDWIEPTVAHALRRRSAALRGRAYGEALYIALAPSLPASGVLRVLEIGAGTGNLAEAFLRAARGNTDRFAYHILDISPTLIAAQRRHLGDRVHWHRGDAREELPAGLEFDLILVNEVLANLDVNRAPDGHVQQTGAHALIRRLAHALAPGGRAVLIEYGGYAQAPEQVAHLGHEESSVDFSDLRTVAARAGLAARIVPLAELLDADRSAPMLVAQQERCHCLRAFFQDCEAPAFEFRAYDREEFDASYAGLVARYTLTRLTFAPLYAGHQFGPNLLQFLALIVERP